MGKDSKRLTPVERAELALVDRTGHLARHPAIKAIGAIGNVGDQPPLLALSAVVMGAGLLRRDVKLARTGARMTLSHLLATAVKTLGKDHIDRSRPRSRIEEGHYEAGTGTSHDPALRSFPSGHTAGAVALGESVAREFPESRTAARSVAGMIGLLQVPRRAHFPTDVLAGAVIGVAAEFVVAVAVDTIWRLRSSR
jgi:membrane-associated phospholipid phosphatase